MQGGNTQQRGRDYHCERIRYQAVHAISVGENEGTMNYSAILSMAGCMAVYLSVSLSVVIANSVPFIRDLIVIV